MFIKRRKYNELVTTVKMLQALNDILVELIMKFTIHQDSEEIKVTKTKNNSSESKEKIEPITKAEPTKPELRVIKPISNKKGIPHTDITKYTDNFLEVIRLNLGMTQKAILNQIGLSQPVYARIINNSKPISSNSRERIINYLNFLERHNVVNVKELLKDNASYIAFKVGEKV